MDLKKASALNDAIARTGHQRNDFRTDEAKRYTRWMEDDARESIPTGGLLLDLGCAAGKQTFQAEQLGARVIGLDCAFAMLSLARQVAQVTGSRAAFLTGDYTALPFAADCLDAVLFPKNLVECSYAEAERLAREIARVLKPGGRLILTIPDCLMQFTAHPQRFSDFDPVTGRSVNPVTIPGQGEYENPGYFWTCGYAVHVFSHWLRMISMTEMEQSNYLIVMEK